MDIVGCSLFGSRYLRSALNVQFHAPPQVNSRHMPCAFLHAAAPSQCLIISIIVIILILLIIIIIIIIRFAIRIFRHPFAPYPTVRWKWQVRASIGTAKATLGFVLILTVFFFPRTMRVSDNIPPNGPLNRLSDDQPWQSWGALFSDPDISVQLWMSSFMPVHGSWTTQAGVTSQRQSEPPPPPSPPSKGTLAICLASLFTQQPLRSVSSSSPPSSSSSTSSSSSSSSPSSFDLKFGFFDIHFPSTQRCDESDRFEHP